MSLCKLCNTEVQDIRAHIYAAHSGAIFCGCICHQPGESIRHFVACCAGPCSGCGRSLISSPLADMHRTECDPSVKNPKDRHKLRPKNKKYENVRIIAERTKQIADSLDKSE